MNKLLRLFSVFALLAFSSCSSKSDAPADNGNSDDSVPEGLSGNTLKISIPTHTVQPGDNFDCYYTDTKLDRDIYVNRSTGQQGQGGHHITIYYATVEQTPNHHTCIDAEMAELRQVGAAGTNKGDGVTDLPPGIAVEIPAGKQLVVQTHYINATAGALDVQDEITVHLLPREQVTRFVQSFAVVDGTFEIPPRSQYSRTATCKVPKDLSLIMALGHMHERGTHYKLEHLDANGNFLDTVIDQDWDPSYTSHPPTSRWDPNTPYKLVAGEKLRQTCTWNNESDTKVLFPTEMCIAYTMYLDDQGFVECDANP